MAAAIKAAIPIRIFRAVVITFPDFLSFKVSGVRSDEENRIFLSGIFYMNSKMTTIEISARHPSPMKKIMSAIFSYFSVCLRERIDAYEKILEAKKTIISIPRASSTIVLPDIFENLMKLSKTKQSPMRLAAVGKICWAIFFLSLLSAMFLYRL